VEYQVPQIDAEDFVTYISAAVLQLTKSPSMPLLLTFPHPPLFWNCVAV
jgi:hypothetical protein